MTDYKQLCADLADRLEISITSRRADANYHEDRDAIDHARTALAEPEPDGLPVWTEAIYGDGAVFLKDGVMVPIEEVVRELNRGAQARAVLARWGNHPGSPDSSGNLKAGLTRSPAAGEVAELVAWLRAEAEDAMGDDAFNSADYFTRATDLLERLSPPHPVPVSKRWPEFSDCDNAERVWCWSWAIGTWRLSRINQSIHSHWLPAHALPLPGEWKT